MDVQWVAFLKANPEYAHAIVRSLAVNGKAYMMQARYSELDLWAAIAVVQASVTKH